MKKQPGSRWLLIFLCCMLAVPTVAAMAPMRVAKLARLFIFASISFEIVKFSANLATIRHTRNTWRRKFSHYRHSRP